jgi:phosphoenolpyruvate synthase/pyruvate phosphate dikinase
MASSENISWFAEISLNDRPAVGGKGGSLGELARAGISVPAGFVVRTTALSVSSRPWMHKAQSGFGWRL